MIFENCGSNKKNYILHNQDVAIKRFPTHFGMHWAIEAAIDVLNMFKYAFNQPLDFRQVKHIEIIAPASEYINRPLPTSEHEARHSFQFNVAATLLDGFVTPQTFDLSYRSRPNLLQLLQRIQLKTHLDNHTSFDDMYVSITLVLDDGQAFQGRCETPYGHWRRPLSNSDLKRKFLHNTASLPISMNKEIIKVIDKTSVSSEELLRLLASR